MGDAKKALQMLLADKQFIIILKSGLKKLRRNKIVFGLMIEKGAWFQPQAW